MLTEKQVEEIKSKQENRKYLPVVFSDIAALLADREELVKQIAYMEKVYKHDVKETITNNIKLRKLLAREQAEAAITIKYVERLKEENAWLREQRALMCVNQQNIGRCKYDKAECEKAGCPAALGVGGEIYERELPKLMSDMPDRIWKCKRTGDINHSPCDDCVCYVSVEVLEKEIKSCMPPKSKREDSITPFANQVITMGYDAAANKILSLLREMAGGE